MSNAKELIVTPCKRCSLLFLVLLFGFTRGNVAPGHGQSKNLRSRSTKPSKTKAIAAKGTDGSRGKTSDEIQDGVSVYDEDIFGQEVELQEILEETIMDVAADVSTEVDSINYLLREIIEGMWQVITEHVVVELEERNFPPDKTRPYIEEIVLAVQDNVKDEIYDKLLESAQIIVDRVETVVFRIVDKEEKTYAIRLLRQLKKGLLASGIQEIKDEGMALEVSLISRIDTVISGIISARIHDKLESSSTQAVDQ